MPVGTLAPTRPVSSFVASLPSLIADGIIATFRPVAPSPSQAGIAPVQGVAPGQGSTPVTAPGTAPVQGVTPVQVSGTAPVAPFSGPVAAAGPAPVTGTLPPATPGTTPLFVDGLPPIGAVSVPASPATPSAPVGTGVAVGIPASVAPPAVGIPASVAPPAVGIPASVAPPADIGMGTWLLPDLGKEWDGETDDGTLPGYPRHRLAFRIARGALIGGGITAAAWVIWRVATDRDGAPPPASPSRLASARQPRVPDLRRLAGARARAKLAGRSGGK
jgi:hypothetical protein